MCSRWLDAYCDVEQIGRGAFGDVMKGRPKEGARQGSWVALKQVDLHRIDNELVRQRTRKEAELMSRFDHWGIVKLYTYLEDVENEKLYLEMEYCSDGDLEQAIRDQKSELFCESQIRNWFTQLVLAVQVLHEHFKVIHRDLKPMNIFLMENKSRIKLGDFGISKVLNEFRKSTTTNGLTLGTTAYMSPQALMGEKASFKDDIWSLGVVLFELATLHRPFTGGSNPSAVSIYMSITQNDKKRAYEVKSSQLLRDLLDNLLQIDADMRPEIGQIVVHSFLKSALIPYNPDQANMMQGASEDQDQKITMPSSNNIENTTTREELEKAKQEIEQLQEEIEQSKLKHQAEVAELKSLLKDANEMNDGLRFEVQTARLKWINLRNLRKLKETELEATLQKSHEQVTELKAKESIVERLEASLKVVKLKVAESDEQLSEYQSELEELKNRLRTSEDQLKAAQLKVAESDEKLLGQRRQAEAKISELTEENYRLQLKISNTPNIIVKDSRQKKLFDACWKGETNLARNLLKTEPVHVDAKHNRERHGQIGVKTEWKGSSCLMFAVRNRKLETCRMLIAEFDANVNQQTEISDHGWTALHFAITGLLNSDDRVMVDIIRLLCSEGKANLEMRTTNEGATPLILAAKNPVNFEIIQYLILEKGAAINEKDFDGMTPLHWAAANCTDENGGELIDFLLDRGADAAAMNESGAMAFQLARPNVAQNIKQALKIWSCTNV